VKRWTQEEIDFLRANYTAKGAVWVAKELNRTKSAVNTKAENLKIPGKGPWSQQEDEFLKKYYPKKGSVWVSKNLDRTQSSVNSRAEKLRIRRSNRWKKEDIQFLKSHYSSNNTRWIADQLGFSFESVRNKAETLKLKKVFWTDEEKDYLVNNYGKVSISAIACKLNKSYGCVASYAKLRKLTVKGKRNTLPEKIVAHVLKEIGVDFKTGFKIKTGLPSDANWHYYWPDFLIDKNIVLEVYGDYWHCNPNIFPDGPIGRQIKIAERDQIKEAFYKSSGYKLIVLWESEIENSSDLISLLRGKLAPLIGNNKGIIA
jgi:G:T-mismatch repair DNA endonuclease (very short patch repair protein)